MKSNYDRSLELLCPTCAGVHFNVPDDENDPGAVYTCLSCGGNFTHDQILESNSERVEKTVEEIKSEIVKDIESDFKKMFRKFGK